MDIKPVALNTFAFAAWMKFIAFKKSEHLSTKVRGVELLFWSSDFCVSPVISAETIQLQGGPKLTWCRAWYSCSLHQNQGSKWWFQEFQLYVRRVTTNMPIRRVIEETPFLVADEPVADSAANTVVSGEGEPPKQNLPSFLL